MRKLMNKTMTPLNERTAPEQDASARNRAVSTSMLVPEMVLTGAPLHGDLIRVRLATDFGAKLKAARKAIGMTQKKLGKAIGLDKHSASTIISGIELGRSIPTAWRARMLCEVVGIPVTEMFERVPADEE